MYGRVKFITFGHSVVPTSKEIDVRGGRGANQIQTYLTPDCLNKMADLILFLAV